MEYMERIVPAARGHTVVVEHTIERVTCGLSRSSSGRGHDIEWDFELWRELDRFSDLDYATRRRVIEEALEMKNEHGWERLDQHLLARFARV